MKFCTNLALSILVGVLILILSANGAPQNSIIAQDSSSGVIGSQETTQPPQEQDTTDNDVMVFDEEGAMTTLAPDSDPTETPQGSVELMKLAENKESAVIATTSLGQVRGQILRSRGGLTYKAFVGIPYGTAKRFQVAQSPASWEGVRDALNYSAVCPQPSVPSFVMSPTPISGEEDCLYINLFVPTADRCKDEGKLLPILFHIHGGGFTVGSGGQYEPDYLMDECLLYVSFNYRLGALGFLATGDGEIEGNLGLKDALRALQWTRLNAANFRGDQNLITLIGISAGAQAVSHFIASPAAKGLFHRAIAQSGTALDPSAIVRNPWYHAKKVGQSLNCSIETTRDLKNCLMKAKVEDLVANQEKHNPWYANPLSIGPVIEEKESKLNEDYAPFQTKDPSTLLQSGDFNRVPLINGVTKDEGILLRSGRIFKEPKLLKELNENWHQVAPVALYYDDLSTDLKNNISDKIKQFYFQNRPIGNNTYQELTNLFSDRLFVMGSVTTQKFHSKFAPVYPYVFSYKGPFSLATLFGYHIPPKAAVHGDDGPFLFHGSTTEFKKDSVDEKLSQNLVKMWAHFAKTGEPGETWTKDIEWRQPSERVTFKIDVPAENLVDYLTERKIFWQNLGLNK